MGLLAQIVGNFTTVVEFPIDKNELCPGVVAILVNMELSEYYVNCGHTNEMKV